MRWFGSWVRRIRYLLRREREEREVEEEMRFHIEMEARELVESGVPPEEAARRARVAFGGTDRHRERVRDARGVGWIEDLGRDLALGLRGLGRSPAFSLTALVVLALGIGATTAIFGVVKSVLLDPLPYPAPERIVRLWPAIPERGELRVSFSVPDLRDWAEASASLESLGAWTTLLGDVVLTGEGPAEEVPTAYVAGDFFGVFGVPAAVGRTLRPDEEDPASRVVVLSHEYWTRRFGGDRSLVGRTLTLDRQPFEVVGVMPPGFAAPEPGVDAWVFLSTVAQSSVPWRLRFVRFLQGVGRLEPGVTPARAAEELTGVAAGVARANPEANEGVVGATVVPLRDVLVGDVRGALWVLLGAVGFILLVACTNVANLLLARGSRRRAELAVRMSLGAGRTRIFRQLLAESAVLGVLGGLAGLAVAVSATRLLVLGAEGFLPRAGEVGVDPAVLLFALGLTGLTVVLFGALPAARTAEVSLGEALRDGGRGEGFGGGSVALRRLLVGGEVALALVLLVGAVLLVRSLDRLYRVDPGFEPERVATMTLTISTDVYPERADYVAFHGRILEEVARLPGVRSVGSIRRLPPRGGGEQWEIAVPGLFEPGPTDDADVDAVHVGGDVFRTLGIEVLAGRVFEERDGADAPPVVVVDETLVDRFFGGADPVGRTVVLGDDEWEVVGVVEAVRHHGLTDPSVPTVYVHQEQNARVGMTVVAKTTGDPAALLPELRNVLGTLDPDQPVTELAPASAALSEATARPRFLTFLMGAFAGLAALLAGLGIYGVIAYTVRQRIREVGLRMALGARRGDVIGMVVRQGMPWALGGLLVGLPAALLLSRFLESLLFEVEPLDPVAYGSAVALLGALALAACLVPAARASRLEPMAVLRSE